MGEMREGRGRNREKETIGWTEREGEMEVEFSHGERGRNSDGALSLILGFWGKRITDF